mmetsp:Transcript_23578/g.23772  ORF Transcript_23578/g.23772 Transcript_23578/m.23772 type:complete len:345 (+) Transcript_23578:206-1240(+)|eukprot:CAMPEP_0182420768 /NCGR_PEP_ID=MMETSP1167-20130531/5829_1 /TAXON_ID=2988 /ORGANISM="Mallomonas Sp, Strain CCMP3275" /LENGTH=344 /DNA_ID=CAMNT_0024597185 /DNA_START=149 /DNA_END=1183 /DNA_ORIENTATION=+
MREKWSPRSNKSWTNASLLTSMIPRLFFVSALILWVFLFSTAKSLSYSHSLLRGSIDNHDTSSHINESSMEKDTPNTIDKENFDHCIIVPGHAAMRISKQHDASYDENAWYLLPYQIGMGFPSIITSHIRKALDILQQDKKSLLIFSGGQTRHDVGPFSEAASYYFLATGQNWIQEHQNIDRVYLEEYARDSFENLLFSLCRFHEITGRYPDRVSVVGFDFKSHRFSDLHRKAIGFPEKKFVYYGIRPDHPFDHKQATVGEKTAIHSFIEDMYGCSTPALVHKRHARDPFSRTIPYSSGCPDLEELLTWCGPDLYPKELPWTSSPSTSTYTSISSRERKRTHHI